MNRNRWIIAILAITSVLIIYASTWFGWAPWNTLQRLHGDWTLLPDYVRAPSEIPPSTILSALTTLLTMFLTGTLVLLLFPDRIRRMEKALHTSPAGLLRLTLIGLLAGVVIAAIGISAALTMSTFPLIFILGIILFISAFSGFLALSYALGHQLMQVAGWADSSPLYGLLLGLLILFALSRVPILGIVLQVLFISLGIGCVMATHFGTGQSWNLSALNEE
jgi:uncharacterized protein YjeT (DUF2065 family)